MAVKASYRGHLEPSSCVYPLTTSPYAELCRFVQKRPNLRLNLVGEAEVWLEPEADRFDDPGRHPNSTSPTQLLALHHFFDLDHKHHQPPTQTTSRAPLCHTRLQCFTNINRRHRSKWPQQSQRGRVTREGFAVPAYSRTSNLPTRPGLRLALATLGVVAPSDTSADVEGVATSASPATRSRSTSADRPHRSRL